MKKTLIIFSLLVSTSSVMSQAAYNSQACEDARDKLLAPGREAKIQECQSDAEKDPDWCVRFYADYGDATSAGGGKMNKRLFDNIPECTEQK